MIRRLVPIMLIGGMNIIAYKVLCYTYPVDMGSQVVGAVASVIAGYLCFWMGGWLTDVERQDKPQTIVLKTTETPSQVTIRSMVATLYLVLVSAVFLALVVLAIKYL